ncbi:hypothetical protein B0H17DRAFT_1091321 [Mycena rosella]|uniref:Uncharacterized protein n=1 Tax=Mycena rosella TaxID=1033263 RepID=A0AAD7CVD9_MYCRO|nr:hypothetical protein B0H17DRAFT_1091321 [Mycena rosella]
MTCAHCGGAFRENDGARCAWHDGVLAVPAEAEGKQRWSCCAQDGDVAGCVTSLHVPPRATRPKDDSVFRISQVTK